jgi:DUF3014 family protein
MSELPDLELRRVAPDPPLPPSSTPGGPGLWIAVAVLLVAVGAAAYVAFSWRSRPAPSPAPVSAPSTTLKESPPLGGPAQPMTLPPLDASDTLVRTLVQALSESAAVVAWLPTTGLIRNFTVVVTNIAEGATPAKNLKVLRPAAPFRTVDRGGGTVIDPRSYARYAPIADAIASVDPAAAAKLYATLKPRIEEAHRDLGTQDQSFDRTLERAIVSLLETPTVDGDVRLRPKGIGYAYADPQLESLTAAQRQLLRMGPRNVRVIKGRLRDIALALGIPASHLPKG